MSNPIERASGKRKWGLLFGLLMPINALMTLDRAALVLLAPTFLAVFGLTLFETTLLISVIIWTYSALQIPAGWAVSRFGVRWTMAIGLIVWSSSMLLTPLAQGFIGLLVLRIILGMGQSPDWSASLAAVKAMFNPTQRARANSIMLSGMYLGTAIGAPATAYLLLIAERHLPFMTDWHLPFFVFGGIGLLIAVIWLFVFVEPGSGPGRPFNGNEAPSFISSLKTLIASRQVWSICFFGMCINGIGSLLFMLPLFLTSKTGLSLTGIAWLSAAPALTKYAAVLFSGVLADLVLTRTGSVWLARTPVMTIGSLIAGTFAFAAALAPGTMMMALFLCVCYLGLGISQVLVWCCVQDLTASQTPVLTGCTNTCGNFGFATAPLLVALIVERFDWTAAFGLYAVLGVLAAILALFIRPDRPLELSPAQGDIEGTTDRAFPDQLVAR